MHISDSYHFLLAIVLLLAAVFALDFFFPHDTSTGYYIYEDRGERDISNSVRPATSFSLYSLRERQQQPRAGYSLAAQLRQCDGQCREKCSENELCLPTYTTKPSFGIPKNVRTCGCLPKSSD